MTDLDLGRLVVLLDGMHTLSSLRSDGSNDEAYSHALNLLEIANNLDEATCLVPIEPIKQNLKKQIKELKRLGAA